MMPVVAGTAFRRIDTVFEVDFTSFTPGAGSLTSTGTLYERLSPQYTVQTSATTVSTDAAFANSNSVPIGKNATGVGIVMDESRAARVTAWRDQSSWTNVGGGTITSDTAAGPDGSVLADQSQTTSGNTGYRLAVTHTANQIWSYWHKSPTGGAIGQAIVNNGSGVFYLIFAGTEPSVWTRSTVYVPSGGSTTSLFNGADGTNMTAIGGLGAGARDSLIDMVQVEDGQFPTETIGAAATRAAPKWYRNVGSTCLSSDSSLRPYFELEPKGACTEYTADMTLWSNPVNGDCSVIDSATQAVKTTVGGVTYTTPVSMSWAREDRLRIFEIVGGSNVTNVQYAVNSSSPIRLSTGSPTTFGSLTISGNLDFLQTNKTKVFSSRCQRLRFYKVNKTPSDF